MRACDPQTLLAAVRIRPAPEHVLALIESHGVTSALMRWGWIGRDGLAKLAAKGQELRRARAGEVAATRSTIITYLRERGIRDYPRVSGAERGRRAWPARIAKGNDRGLRMNRASHPSRSRAARHGPRAAFRADDIGALTVALLRPNGGRMLGNALPRREAEDAAAPSAPVPRTPPRSIPTDERLPL